MAMQCFAKIAALISLATDFQWVGYGLLIAPASYDAWGRLEPARGILGLKPIHSSLSAIIGSIFAARRSGMKQATAAAHTSNNDTAANVSGSVAAMSNNKLFSGRSPRNLGVR